MKSLGIILIVLGVVGLFWPVATALMNDKATASGSGPAIEKKEVASFATFAPLLGITGLATGGGLLVASLLTTKKK